MKITKVLFTAITVAVAFAAGKAGASNVNIPTQLIFNFSGTADFVKTNYVHETKTSVSEIGKTMTVSISEKEIYLLVSNAVANAAGYDSRLPSTHLPADGYIVYNTVTFDEGTNANEGGTGFFYVTNKEGSYFALSGTYANTNYYSYMELDSSIPEFGPYFGLLGFSDTGDNWDFNQVDSYNINETKESGNVNDVSEGLLYIHNDPLSFDAADNPSEYTENVSSVELRGVFKMNVNYQNGVASGGSATLTGNGNIIWNDAYGVLTSGKATFNQ